jgi:hypothetical protein
VRTPGKVYELPFFLLNLKTFTKSATFHEILNELLAMSTLHLMYDVRELPARGRYPQITLRASTDVATNMTTTTPLKRSSDGLSGTGFPSGIATHSGYSYFPDIATFTKSAKLHDTFNELHAMSSGRGVFDWHCNACRVQLVNKYFIVEIF